MLSIWFECVMEDVLCPLHTIGYNRPDVKRRNIAMASKVDWYYYRNG